MLNSKRRPLHRAPNRHEAGGSAYWADETNGGAARSHIRGETLRTLAVVICPMPRSTSYVIKTVVRVTTVVCTKLDNHVGVYVRRPLPDQPPRVQRAKLTQQSFRRTVPVAPAMQNPHGVRRGGSVSLLVRPRFTLGISYFTLLYFTLLK